MKKTMMTLAILMIVCVLSAFALTACNIDLENADYTEDYEATDKEGTVELVTAFFEETLKDPNFVVTGKNKDGEVQFTENVKGTSSYTLGKDGSKLYAYKVDDFFYVANVSLQASEGGEPVEYHNYSCSDSSKPGFFHEYEATINGEKKTVTMEDTYKSYFCQFKSMLYGGINILDYLTDTDGTFSCKSHGERTDGVTTGSLTLTYTTDKGTITITSTSEENLVKTYHVVTTGTDPKDNTEYTMTFEYGNASITLPDTDAWDLEAITAESIAEANDTSSVFSNHDSIALAFTYTSSDEEEDEDEREVSVDYVYSTEDQRIEVYEDDIVIIGTDGIWEYFKNGEEMTYSYHWFVMSDDEADDSRPIPSDFAFINGEMTSRETITDRQKNENGTITITATLSAEDMEDFLQEDYPEGKRLEEKIVYVVNAQTLEILSSNATVYIDGEEDSVTSVNTSYDVDLPDDLNTIVTTIEGFKTGTKVNPRTITIVYDYGTDTQESYEIVADSRYRVIPILRDGYVMYADPDMNEEYGSNDNMSDITIYAFYVEEEE